MSLPAVGNVTDVLFEGNLRIHWTGTGDSYTVRFRQVDDDVWAGPQSTSDDTGITISGLAAGFHYDFEVVTHTNGTPPKIPAAASIPDYYGYVIEQGLTPPTTCQVVDESASQITISWNGRLAGETYVVLVQDENGNSQTITDVPPGKSSGGKTTYTLTIGGLDPDLSYRIYPCIVENQELVFGDCYIDKTKECCDG